MSHSDSKTSHQFTKLNLYTGLSWLTRESKKEEAALNDVPLSDLCEKDKDNHGDTNSDSDDDNEVITSSTNDDDCLLYTSPSPRDRTRSRMPSSA